MTTNFIGDPNHQIFDDAPFIEVVRAAVRSPGGLRRPGAVPGSGPAPATGWTGQLPQSFSPPLEMRMRVLDFGTDKYGLNAYIVDGTNDSRMNYDRVMFSRTKSAADSVGILRQGEFADVKVKIVGGALAGQTAGMLAEGRGGANNEVRRVRLPHAGHPGHRDVANAGRACRVSPATSPSFRRDLPHVDRRDFAVLEAGVVSEETYVQQGLYWSTGHTPMLEYVVNTYNPDLLLAGVPTTDEFSHQFLGLVSPTLPNGAANPAYDDVQVDGGAKDGRVNERDRFIRDAYKEADAFLTKARKLMGKDPATFVSSDHGFAPQFLAIDASKPLVDLGLLSTPQTGNCRPATGETIGKAKACWAGGALQIYLNVVGRDPATPFQQIPANQVDATVAQIKAAYLGLVDPNDWTGDGQPEGWKLIDRVFTKAEARYIPNGPGSTADMAHPTRTGDLVVFSFPPYQFDAETPGTLVAKSHFFGQHGYVPDVQDIANNINMRATFLAGGDGIAKGQVDARTIDIAPTIAYLMGIPEPQQSQGRVLLDVLKGTNNVKPISIIGLTDFHGQLDPTTFTFDGIASPVGGAASSRDDVRRGPRRIAGTRLDPRGGRQRGCVAAELGTARGHPDDQRGERMGSRRDLVRQPRVRLRCDADHLARGRGALPVPRGEHRRCPDGSDAALRDALGRLHCERGSGRCDRR